MTHLPEYDVALAVIAVHDACLILVDASHKRREFAMLHKAVLRVLEYVFRRAATIVVGFPQTCTR
jgi:hypothetical protein